MIAILTLTTYVHSLYPSPLRPIRFLQVHRSTRATPETFKALNGGLGLLGAVTEIVLQLTPTTNTQLKTLINQPDDNIYEVIESLLKVRGLRGAQGLKS
jgi:hypothetical protein